MANTLKDYFEKKLKSSNVFLKNSEIANQTTYIMEEKKDISKILNDDLLKCYKILMELKNHHYAGPFIEPVDTIKLNLPDYLTIIRRPMDLGTVIIYWKIYSNNLLY